MVSSKSDSYPIIFTITLLPIRNTPNVITSLRILLYINFFVRFITVIISSRYYAVVVCLDYISVIQVVAPMNRMADLETKL